MKKGKVAGKSGSKHNVRDSTDAALRHISSTGKVLGETAFEFGKDHSFSLQIGDEYAHKIWSMVDEAITVMETVKKIPDFNADLSVELAYSCASMKAFTSDPRADERYLEKDEEPVSAAHNITLSHPFPCFTSNLCCASALEITIERQLHE